MMKSIYSPYQNRYNGGFSAIEVMLAVVILVIGIIPMIMIFSRMTTGLTDRQTELEAANQGAVLMEKIERLRWDETTPTPPQYVDSSTLAVFGPDTGETDSTLYDDVDDYNNYIDDVNGFARKVNVFYCTDTSGTIQTTASVTDIKLIRIKVTWTRGVQRSLTMESIKINGGGA